MFVTAGERRGQPLDRIGVELGIGRIAVPLGVGPADIGNSREALSAGGRCAAREGALTGGGVENPLLRVAIRKRRVVDRCTEQRPNCPGLEVARTLPELLVTIFGAGSDGKRLCESNGIVA